MSSIVGATLPAITPDPLLHIQPTNSPWVGDRKTRGVYRQGVHSPEISDFRPANTKKAAAKGPAPLLHSLIQAIHVLYEEDGGPR